MTGAHSSPRSGRIHTRAMFAGGHLQLVGLPERDREQVVLAIRPVAALDDACDLHLYRDGEPLTLGERQRQRDHSFVVALRIGELGPSARFRGAVCGQSLELDAAARDTIASFADRFRERVAELSDAPGVSIANAR